jgi:nitrogen regulatory protein PII
MYMVMLVLDDPQQLDDVLDAWHATGVSGVTIVESTGINRHRKARQIGTGFMAGMNRLMAAGVEGHYTLFVIVPDSEMVKSCISATESVIGNLDQPDVGVLASWSLEVVKGVPHKNQNP